MARLLEAIGAAMKACTIEGCDKPVRARGWCAKHYTRWHKYGDPREVHLVIDDDHARFWAFVDRSGDCWIWTGSLTHNGYGRFWYRGKQRRAHRVIYELEVGPIPDGHQVDHLCGNPRCVRPTHLEAVTPRENVLRGDTIVAANIAKTHCPQGHPYSGNNLVRLQRGWRGCRACRAVREAQHV